jgi:hypothetical protein
VYVNPADYVPILAEARPAKTTRTVDDPLSITGFTRSAVILERPSTGRPWSN